MDTQNKNPNTDPTHKLTSDDFSPEENAARLRGVLDDVKKIASGGMAHIFQARQPALDRYIVIKKLRWPFNGR